MGIVSKVVSTVRKIDGIYTMLQGAVKKIDEVYIFVEGKRHLVFPESTLIYEKTTGGSYSFTVPDKYNFITVEIGGGNGGSGAMWYSTGNEWVESGSGGKGEKIILEKASVKNRVITIVVGQNGQTPGNGGTGYSNGANGTHITPGGSNEYGGGGGGSTAITLNGVTYEASGGGGATLNMHLNLGTYHATGGKGGGPKGGAPGVSEKANTATNGGNATGNLINQNNSGYIKIYGIAG